MTMILRNFGHWIPLYLGACLVIAGATAALYAWRHRGHGTPWTQALLTWLIACWGLGVAVVTLFPTAFGQAYDATTGLPARSLDLVPFGLASGEGFSVAELAANTVMFMAGGYLLALKWRLNPWRTMAVGTAIALGIEGLQFALGIGRISSLDDVMWAAFGSLTGGACAAVRPLRERRRVLQPTP